MKVMAFGTFDVIHPGHSFYLKRAKKLGKELVVVVGRDLTVKKVKGRMPQHMEQRRLSDVKKMEIADKVILGYLSDQLRIVEEEKPDTIALGYDQRAFTEDLFKKLKERGLLVDIVRIPSYKPSVNKSSIIKKMKFKF
jgi:FAD synthetase